MHDPWLEFTRSLAGESPSVPARLRELPGASAAERFAVHRRNRRHALVDALAARHPVVEALVGVDFFRALADGFVRHHPPHSASLLDYGKDFGDYLDACPPAQAVACLADVARLENAWHEAYHAREAPSLELRSLATLDAAALLQARFEPHPATRCLASRHPVGSLWQAHRAGATASPLDGYAAECVLVVRPHADVEVHVLPAGDRPFVETLLRASPLEDAAAAGSESEPALLLRRFIEIGALTRVIPHSPERPTC